MKDKTLQIFFWCAGVSMLIASIRVAVSVNSMKDYITNWFTTIMSILYTGVTSGVAAMLGYVFVQHLKKNLNYDC